MDEKKFDRAEVLEDGKVLTILINEHCLLRNENSFIAVLNCLSDDPPVWVPMSMRVSDEDVESFMNAGVGQTVTTKNEIRMKPDILKNGEGELFFPCFSMQEETPEEYRSRFSWVKLPFSNCVRVARQTTDLKGIVLNGFTNSVVLPNSMLDVFANIFEESSDM